jgi:hypothetical protein
MVTNATVHAAVVYRATAENAAFGEICEKFRALEARKTADEAHVNFEQAQLIRDARVRLKVPVAAIGEALGLSAQSINTYRNVAERIDRALFRELIGERLGAISPFPWSVIAQVARLEDQGERGEVIEKIRRCGWRTRDVEAFVSSRRSARVFSSRNAEGRKAAEVEPGPLPPGRSKVSGDVPGEEAGDVTSLVSALGREMLVLVNAAGDAARPALISIAADLLVRVVVDAAQAVASVAGRAPSQELGRVRDALSRCAAVISDARVAIGTKLAEAEALEPGGRGVLPRRYPCGATSADPAASHAQGRD